MGPWKGNVRGGGSVGRGGGVVQPYPLGRDAKNELKQSMTYFENVKKNMPTFLDDLSLYCPACSYQSVNCIDYLDHYKSKAHKNQIARLDDKPVWIKKQVLDLIKKVDDQRKAFRVLKHCEICDLNLEVPYSEHKNMELHKTHLVTMKVGCQICQVKNFKNFPEFRTHLKTDEHMKKAEVHQMEFEEKIEKCKSVKDFPTHKDGICYSQKSIVPAIGFYCRLCKRFFPEEERAMTHRYHRSHYINVMEMYYKKNKPSVDMGEYPEPKEPKSKVEEMEKSDSE